MNSSTSHPPKKKKKEKWALRKKSDKSVLKHAGLADTLITRIQNLIYPSRSRNTI